MAAAVSLILMDSAAAQLHAHFKRRGEGNGSVVDVRRGAGMAMLKQLQRDEEVGGAEAGGESRPSHSDQPDVQRGAGLAMLKQLERDLEDDEGGGGGAAGSPAPRTITVQLTAAQTPPAPPPHRLSHDRGGDVDRRSTLQIAQEHGLPPPQTIARQHERGTGRQEQQAIAREKAVPWPHRLPHSKLLQLKRWNTPTIYNGWEQITRHDASKPTFFNLEETRDFMPQMGPMVGYAVTVVIEPSNVAHRRANLNAWTDYRKYVASVPGPKIVCVQDLDKPRVIGAFWGEVNSNAHLALGCVGSICDGAIRDVDEMTNAGFHAIARRLCVGHAHSWPARWGCPVEVFGTTVTPGQLIHADKHGFLAIPPEDEIGLLEASVFMDSNECGTIIPASRGATGCSTDEVIKRLEEAGKQFGWNVEHHDFGAAAAGHAAERRTRGGGGEW